MWTKFRNSNISIKAVIINLILEGFDQKSRFFGGMVIAQVQYLRLVLYVEKGLKIKTRNFWGLILNLNMVNFSSIFQKIIFIKQNCPNFPEASISPINFQELHFVKNIMKNFLRYISWRIFWDKKFSRIFGSPTAICRGTLLHCNAHKF